jgi:hypothetical protein
VAAAEVCPECGEVLAGDFCHRCGEKRPEARDLSVRHFVLDAAKELTSLDSKLTRTLLALLFRPGRLTNEWIAGRRGRYLKPLNLCLGVFALSLFVLTSSKQVSMFNIGLVLENQRQIGVQMKLKGTDVINRRLDSTAERKGLTRQALEDALSERWQRNVSLVQPAEIIALAVLLQLVYLFSRRYFVEHLVFSMHFLSFAVLTSTLMFPVYYLIGMNLSWLNFAVAGLKFLVDVFYLFVALRAVYRDSPGAALLRAPVVFAGYFVIYLLTFSLTMLAAFRSVLTS